MSKHDALLRRLRGRLPARPKGWYTFAVGIGFVRTVTVLSDDISTVWDTACSTLNKRYAAAGREPPVAFDLTLIKFRLLEDK